jgi:hypothetical protein
MVKQSEQEKKLIKKTIENISERVYELIDSIDCKTWNDATLPAFQIGLIKDIVSLGQKKLTGVTSK